MFSGYYGAMPSQQGTLHSFVLWNMPHFLERYQLSRVQVCLVVVHPDIRSISFRQPTVPSVSGFCDVSFPFSSQEGAAGN